MSLRGAPAPTPLGFGGMDELCMGSKAAASLELCWGLSGVRKGGEQWNAVVLKARHRKALNSIGVKV